MNVFFTSCDSTLNTQQLNGGQRKGDRQRLLKCLERMEMVLSLFDFRLFGSVSH